MPTLFVCHDTKRDCAGALAQVHQLHGAPVAGTIVYPEKNHFLPIVRQALVHGRAAAEQAAETARKTFEEGAPAATLPTVEIEDGAGILNAAVATGAVSSTSEARRQIKGGGIKLNGVVVVDEKTVLTSNNATPEGMHILSFGKKRHFQLKRK